MRCDCFFATLMVDAFKLIDARLRFKYSSMNIFSLAGRENSRIGKPIKLHI